MKKLILLFIINYSLLITNCISQWLQQTLPVSGLVYDICFINVNTGFVSMNTPAFLKTTNGGTNWIVTGGQLIYHIQFPDTLNGYAHGYYSGSHKIYKTTNGGLSWDSTFSGFGAYGGISFVNKDTGWVGGWDQSGNTKVWRTTNGGLNFLQQYTTPGNFITEIFFTKQRYGNEYYGWYSVSGALFYTTNSGLIWTQYANLPNSNAGSIFFLNKDTGWVTNSSGNPYIMHTTNNGIDWLVQNLPNGLGAGDIYFHNNNTGWAAGGFGKIVATANSGFNWGTQTIPFFTINAVFFINSITGWCGGNGIARTTNGGGNIVYDGIQQISSEIPQNFKLYQNYPNPFNSQTIIRFSLLKDSYVTLKVYDVTGKEKTIWQSNKLLSSGIHQLNFNAADFSSGIYFYKLIVTNYNKENLFTGTKKMIILK